MKQSAINLGIPFLQVRDVRSPEFYGEYVKLRPDLNIQLATPVFRSEDFSEAQKAFKEKRRPEWKLR
jgi:hypothetical protein